MADEQSGGNKLKLNLLNHKVLKRRQLDKGVAESVRVRDNDADSESSLLRRRLLKTVGLASSGILLPMFPAIATAARSRLLDYRFAYHDNATLFIDLNQKPDSLDMFLLENPHRLVIDMEEVSGAGAKSASFSDGLVSGVRFGKHENKLRMVVDLRAAVRPDYHVLERHTGVRVHIDLGVPGSLSASTQTREPASGKQRSKPLRDVIVAIDAGHGGKDPGAIGQKKTLEKNVTLEIAQRLARELSQQKGIQVAMIRNSDTYIGLGERTDRARSKNADIFLSLHADAFPRKEAKGSSVYALSLKGASSEAAKFLAEQENAYDPLEGIDMGDMSADLKRTLIELSQSSTIESSLDMGGRILNRLGRVGNVHKPKVEQANFAVLRSPDIPSVLVETAFISNLREERKLNSSRFQKRLALAIRAGVLDYLKVRAPGGSWLAENSG